MSLVFKGHESCREGASLRCADERLSSRNTGSCFDCGCAQFWIDYWRDGTGRLRADIRCERCKAVWGEAASKSGWEVSSGDEALGGGGDVAADVVSSAEGEEDLEMPTLSECTWHDQGLIRRPTCGST